MQQTPAKCAGSTGPWRCHTSSVKESPQRLRSAKPIYIRRPRPSPRQGRRLGPPQVWSLFLLACYYLAFCQALRPLPSVVKGVQACRLPGLKCLKRCAAASSRRSGHCPLLLRAFKPAVCQASNASNAARQLRPGTQATALCC